ncbi:MAG: hypothetical protein GXC78_11225 [Chitinophagaceae bacterium]|nr:hypothetical protein [Chitinophagaceae bacterium]
MSKFKNKLDSFGENRKDITGPGNAARLNKFKENGKSITTPTKPTVSKTPPEKIKPPALKPRGPKL